jgi:hypothetical protein
MAIKKKKALHRCKALSLLAPRPGLEPGTYGLTDDGGIENAMFYAGCSVKNTTVQYCV